MENTNYKADRSTWGRGPWDQEPEDRIDFVHAGFAAFIKRGPMGVWCGYVGVPNTHPLYGKSYGDADDAGIEVHGGLTYANKCAGEICHVPEPGMPDDVWWFGFDCGHWNDIVPSMARYHEETGIYRDKTYAIEQARLLAAQLKDVK